MLRSSIIQLVTGVLLPSDDICLANFDLEFVWNFIFNVNSIITVRTWHCLPPGSHNQTMFSTTGHKRWKGKGHQGKSALRNKKTTNGKQSSPSTPASSTPVSLTFLNLKRTTSSETTGSLKRWTTLNVVSRILENRHSCLSFSNDETGS